MTRWLFLTIALVAPVLTFIAAGLSHPESAAAHPLGNFTVNRYSRLELYSDAVRVRYVLDMAEIPAFQEIDAIDTNGDGDLSSLESDTFVTGKSREIVGNLRLSINGSTAHYEVLSSNITYPAGQAGLQTVRVGLLLQSPIAASRVSLEYTDDNYSDRIGWKEIVVQPAPGVLVSNSSAATEDRSAELTAYPDDLLSSPLDVTSAAASYDAQAGSAAPPVTPAQPVETGATKAPERAGGGFASLIDSDDITVPVMLISLLLALGFGAIHALEPGHGKTFVAAYFVGVRGTVRQALGLGLIVAVTHTIGVLTIGLVVLFGSQYILPERLYPWLSLASGLMVLALGVRLIAARAGGWQAVRRLTSILNKGEARGDHDHGHDHSHVNTREAPPWKSLLALGLADGLTPSPSALVVLLAAVSLDRIGLGLLLIVAFSVGLAAVLTLVSLALLYARRFVEWLNHRKSASGKRSYVSSVGGILGSAVVLRIAPLGSALALVVIGSVLTVRALMAPGLPVL
jgi:nickel/cobalt transporter (NicO) family protein